MGLVTLSSTNPMLERPNGWPDGNSWLMLLSLYNDLVLLNSSISIGTGSVVDVSVITANGFSATVANSNVTPAITLKTTITGILKGNGTAMSAAINSDITSFKITGFISGAGVVLATDSILEAIQKLNGNTNALVTGVSSVFGRSGAVISVSGDYNTNQVTEALNLYFTNARAIASILNGFTSAVGTITAADSVLSAIGKLDGNVEAIKGQLALFTWKYSTNTAAADPGSGNFRANNATPALITQLYIDDLTSNNQIDISNLFDRVNGEWLLHIQQRNDASKWMQFNTATAYVDNAGWWTLPVNFEQQGSGGVLTNLTDCLFTFVNKNNPTISKLSIVNKIANYIITNIDYCINCTANSFTVTLPTAVGIEGRVYVIKNSGVGIITVDTTSSETIDGDLTHLIGTKVSVTAQSTGSEWILI